MNRPAYLGRGRGSARNQNNVKVPPGISSPQESSNNIATEAPDFSPIRVANERLAKVEQIREAASRYADNVVSESDSSGSDTDNEEKSSHILSETLKSYGKTLGDSEYNVKPNQLLNDVLMNSAITCLVCIESVKKQQEVWSCVSCYCIYHIQCIQMWARQDVYNATADDEKSLAEAKWLCPNCRYGYSKMGIPTRYMCFCGKLENPKFDPWLVPHSCGQTCSKELQPKCGHSCLLLCHPGACPPCPKTVKAPCHCGKVASVPRRCSNQAWSCKTLCNKILRCGQHHCQIECHPGDCPPCPRQSTQNCDCGKYQSMRKCAEPKWNCTEVCNKPLPCGFHICERTCHDESCGDCPRQGKRRCPCGKNEFEFPCTEDIKSCEDTCGKTLSCGQHSCTKLCHYGACETCWHSVTKKCRCGKREKDMPCCQEFVCNIKCTNMRQCGRHQCRRKCCDGSCPPCEQICNRSLSCKNHKCPSTCHQGMCYPCPLMKELSCNCGVSTFSVPCGRERTTKPPKCNQPCRTPPSCHHEKREPHRCHYGNCPNCRQVCNLPLNGCTHRCQEKCHQHIPDREAMKPAPVIPWEKKTTVKLIPKKCNPCEAPINRWCFGLHEEETHLCSDDKPFSCRRPCGRQLPCGNHQCQRECHVVKGATDDFNAGRNCLQCEEQCSKPRPKDCKHECPRPCHPGLCSPCSILVKLPCLCEANHVFVKCSEFYSTKESKRIELRACKGMCAKQIGCGHPCSKTCHLGSCSNVDECDWKVKQICPCRRKKKDFPCHVVQSQSEGQLLPCDDKCKEQLARKLEDANRKKDEESEALRKKEQEEIEKFERKKFGTKKRKPRQTSEDNEENPLYRNSTFIFSSAIVIAMVAFFCVFLYHNVFKVSLESNE